MDKWFTVWIIYIKDVEEHS